MNGRVMERTPEMIVAGVLKRLYPQNPDVVLGREARTIVAALKDEGWEMATTLFLVITEEIKAENERMREWVEWMARINPEECWYDHNDLCQAHNLNYRPCPMEGIHAYAAQLRTVDDAAQARAHNEQSREAT